MSRFAKPVQLPVGVGVEGFHCGDEVVDNWAAKHSESARKRGTAVIYASYCNDEVAGFYTLSAHSVNRAEVSGGWFARNAPAQVPAVLLGMLGVDDRYKACGLGSSLLKDAIENSMKIAALAGAKALVVDPSSESAASFYARFGFSTLPGTSRMALRL